MDGMEEKRRVLAGLAGATVVTSLRGRTGSGGSRPGKKANIDRAEAKGAALLYHDYFSESPTYRQEVFKRRYRLPRSLFLRVHKAILEDDPLL